MPSSPAPPTSASVRRRSILGAYVSLGLAVVSIPLSFISLTPSMILWAVGIAGYVGCVVSLLKATGGQTQSSRLDDLDEYQRERALIARSRAMNILLCGLLAVMLTLLTLPALITTLQPSPEETATWVRAIGMSAGIIALGSTIAIFRDIATGMNRDETLSPDLG